MGDPYAKFMELQEKDFPGRLPPVNRKNGDPEKDDSVDVQWDAKPVVYNYGGHAREFFTIGHLATALGRSPVTIRSWENKGVLPKSPFRSPSPKTSAIQGGKPKGKRLWTRSQIEGLLSIAAEEGCIVDEKQSPPTTNFTLRATDLFLEIREKETQSS